MCNSKEEKVFRKEGKKFSTRVVLLELGLVFIFLVVLALIFTIVSTFQLNLTTFTVLSRLLITALFILLLIILISSFNTSPSYTLTLKEDTLTYKAENNTVILQLPCSVKKTDSTITFSQNDMKIVLGYTEQEDTELLEFLKDIINWWYHKGRRILHSTSLVIFI